MARGHRERGRGDDDDVTHRVILHTKYPTLGTMDPTHVI